MKKRIIAIITILTICFSCMVSALGCVGKTPTIEISSDGYWIINGEKTEYKAVGKDGTNGQNGMNGKDGVSPTIEISSDGYWIINGEKTEYKAVGKDGTNGQNGMNGKDGVSPTIEISSDGYWIINGEKTEYKVKQETNYENRISCKFIRGGVDEVIATEHNSYARLKCDYIISNQNIFIKNQTDYIARIFLYSYNKTLIRVIDPTADANIQHNGYIRIVLRKTDNSIFSLEEIDNANRNFILLERENLLPSYWNEYMQAKYAKIQNNGLSMGSKGDGLIFITDIHYENNNLMSPLLIKAIQENTNVKKLIIGGDMFDGDQNRAKAIEEIRSWLKLLGDVPYAIAFGNHDSNTSTSVSTNENSISHEELYDLCVRQFETETNTEGKTYYYFDNPSQKIRYFILNTGDGYGKNSVMIDPVDYAEQLSWLYQKSSELDDSWNIVIFQHMFFSAGNVTSSDQTTIGGSTGLALKNAVDVIQKNANLPNVFAVISGHIHRDYSFLTDSGYYCISTTCDAGGALSEIYDPDNPYRTKGTTIEQAFDVFQFDIKNKAIYATRIGAGQDREWHY